MKAVISSKRTPTKTEGVFYKDIFNDSEKSVDKKYMIRWIDENGKSRLKTIGNYSAGIREKYCKAKRDEIITKIRLGEELPSLAKPKQTMTIFDMSELYFDYKSATVKDIEKEKRRFNNHLKKTIGHIKLQNFSEKDALKLQQNLKENLAVASVRHLLVTLNAMYKYVVTQKLYSGDIPTSNIQHEQLNNIRERYLTLDEIKKLLTVCQNTNYEIYLFVKLSLSTGGRVGTIATIRAMDIKPNNNSLILSDHKNNDTYTGFYNNELKELLTQRMKELSATDTIIRLARSSITYKLGSIMDVLFNQFIDDDDRKNRVVPHTLRQIAGTPILTIQKLMNHKSIEMTLRYAKLAPNQGMEAVKNLYS
ncbi:MAG: tyrosine-type recombinase/integrase [Campylobacterales bacterium]|nr:tyrosine-type recombinase/integrase [Campylobacterales bacterium]